MAASLKTHSAIIKADEMRLVDCGDEFFFSSSLYRDGTLFLKTFPL